MPDDIRCEVHRILFPDWTKISTEQKEGIWRSFQSGVEKGEPPERQAFVGVRLVEGVILGFFAHEGTRVALQYDREWTRENQPRAEFEHLFFAFALDEGTVVLQRKRVVGRYVLLNMTILRDDFFELFTTAVQRGGVDVTRMMFEPFTQVRSKEELLTVFHTYQITSVRIGGLLHSRVPDDVKLFNPDEDKDRLLRQVLNDDFDYMDTLEADAGNLGRAANLRNAKTVRGAMLAGQPEVVKAVVDDQERVFRRQQAEVFPMSLGSEPGAEVNDEDVQKVIRIVRTEYFVPAALVRRAVDLGPLFSLLPEEDKGNAPA